MDVDPFIRVTHYATVFAIELVNVVAPNRTSIVNGSINAMNSSVGGSSVVDDFNTITETVISVP